MSEELPYSARHQVVHYQHWQSSTSLFVVVVVVMLSLSHCVDEVKIVYYCKLQTELLWFGKNDT